MSVRLRGPLGELADALDDMARCGGYCRADGERVARARLVVLRTMGAVRDG